MQSVVFPEVEVFLALCKRVGSPVALKAYLLVKAGDFRQLRSMSIRPSDYLHGESFAKDYQIVSFLRKWKGMSDSGDLRTAAVRSFTTSELNCRQTNIRLVSEIGQADVNGIIFSASRKIAEILGEFSLAKVLSCSYTGGASDDLKRSQAQLDKKMIVLPMSVTASALPFFRKHIELDPAWFEALTGLRPCGPYSILPSTFTVVKGGKHETVPKDAKTDRNIVIEPRCNMFLQKGVGDYIRKSLKRVGCNLNSQLRNQELAYSARTCGLATVDLENASDSISKELVFSLLPIDWALYLDAIRSRKVLVDKNWVQLEKFSSMGNGFTFELESLIFYAIVTTIEQDKSRVAVYGDDIIVPRVHKEILSRVFSYIGFTLNTSKTFWDGDFFESCGKHYFDDVDVTPLFQKEVVSSVVPHSFFRLHNRLFRSVSGVFYGLTRIVLKYSPKYLLQYALPGYCESNDGFLHQPPSLVVDVNGGYLCSVLRVEKDSYPGHDPAWYASTLRQLNRREAPSLDKRSLSAYIDSRFPVSPLGYRGEVLIEDREGHRVKRSRMWVPPAR